MKLEKGDIKAIADRRYFNRHQGRLWLLMIAVMISLLLSLLPNPYSFIVPTTILLLVAINLIDLIIMQFRYEREIVSKWEDENK